MNIEQFTIAMLARAMWRAGFILLGRFDLRVSLLYGHVVRNRVQAAVGQVGWIEALNQEGWTAGGNIGREVERPEDPDFLKILWEAERLFLNQCPDLIDGSLAISLEPREGSLPTAKATTAGGVPIYFYKTP